MCNTNKEQEQKTEPNDYRFLDYRITQLENKIERGLEQIEAEQRRYNLEVMKTLHELQQGQNKTTENIAKLRQRLDDLENQLHGIDKLKEITSRNTTSIQSTKEATNHRIDVIQKILFAVGGAAVSAFFTALVSIILLIMQMHLL